MKATKAKIYKLIFDFLIMDIKIIKSEKNELEAEIGNLTIAEILRAYLQKDDSVIFAAWKREHPSKSPILLVKTKGKTAKKAITDAIAKIEKDADKFVSEFKKLK